MPKALTVGQQQEFDSAGFLSPISVLSFAEVQRYSAQCQDFECRIGDKGIIWRRMLHIWFEWAYQLSIHPAVLDAVEDLLGPDIVVLSTILFAKPPDRKQFVSWHQDGRPMVRKGGEMRSLTAWIAMTESAEDNGCLRVIPGSHRNGYHEHVSRANADNMLRRGETVDVDFDESRAVPLVLHPGQMSLHHVDTVHGSAPNTSGEPRTGFTIRFAAADVEVTRELAPRVAARGTPRTDLYPVFTGTPHKSVDAGMASLTLAIEDMLAREQLLGVQY